MHAPRDICSACVDFLLFYLARSQALAEYWIHCTAHFGGVLAFGYNSVESELIWMKSGAREYIVGGWP